MIIYRRFCNVVQICALAKRKNKKKIRKRDVISIFPIDDVASTIFSLSLLRLRCVIGVKACDDNFCGQQDNPGSEKIAVIDNQYYIESCTHYSLVRQLQKHAIFFSFIRIVECVMFYIVCDYQVAHVCEQLTLVRRLI